jgi:hypothetical protein
VISRIYLNDLPVFRELSGENDELSLTFYTYLGWELFVHKLLISRDRDGRIIYYSLLLMFDFAMLNLNQ